MMIVSKKAIFIMIIYISKIYTATPLSCSENNIKVVNMTNDDREIIYRLCTFFFYEITETNMKLQTNKEIKKNYEVDLDKNLKQKLFEFNLNTGSLKIYSKKSVFTEFIFLYKNMQMIIFFNKEEELRHFLFGDLKFIQDKKFIKYEVQSIPEINDEKNIMMFPFIKNLLTIFIKIRSLDNLSENLIINFILRVSINEKYDISENLKNNCPENLEVNSINSYISKIATISVLPTNKSGNSAIHPYNLYNTHFKNKNPIYKFNSKIEKDKTIPKQTKIISKNTHSKPFLNTKNLNQIIKNLRIIESPNSSVQDGIAKESVIRQQNISTWHPSMIESSSVLNRTTKYQTKFENKSQCFQPKNNTEITEKFIPPPDDNEKNSVEQKVIVEFIDNDLTFSDYSRGTESSTSAAYYNMNFDPGSNNFVLQNNYSENSRHNYEYNFQHLYISKGQPNFPSENMNLGKMGREDCSIQKNSVYGLNSRHHPLNQGAGPSNSQLFIENCDFTKDIRENKIKIEQNPVIDDADSKDLAEWVIQKYSEGTLLDGISID
ncbi:hypothetical protein DMUE_4638 [Dictyocoela muelleri]|nr:hypothetical protein DMUE_4638 [Dictyocoela muelleri]